MKVIVNGDDLGYTMGVTEGIIEGCRRGILRSATALMNSAYIREAADLVQDVPDLDIGLHLNLTLGKPLTDCPSLTDPETGLFYKGRTEVWKHNPDYGEIEREWNAQLECFQEVFHKMPDHLDSHHSVHDATPQALEISEKIAEEHHLPMRRYNHFRYVPGMFGISKPGQMIAILKKYDGEDIEIMAHCAFVDLDLYLWSSYSLGRIGELAVLCDPQVLAYVKEHGIEITSYRREYGSKIHK